MRFVKSQRTIWKEKQEHNVDFSAYASGTGHEDDAIVYDNRLPGTYKVKGVLM